MVTILFPSLISRVIKENRTEVIAETLGEAIDKLIEKGVRALIISPFAVDAEFGTRLALEFEKVAGKARLEGQEVSFHEMFDITIENMVAVSDSKGAYQDMALEFILIGNSDLRLCK